MVAHVCPLLDAWYQSLLIKVLCGFFPDLIGHRIGPVTDASERLGERQCSTLSLTKDGVVPSSGYSANALVGLARLFQIAGMQVNADATTIDLAGTQVDQFEHRWRHTALVR